MNTFWKLGCLCFILFQNSQSFGVEHLMVPHSPQESFEELVKGNRRYMTGQLLHPNRSEESRQRVSAEQRPFAVVLGCSDSRVSPEIIFDQGIGDLFVVRVAGNTAGPIEIESMQYAVLYLKSSLILVLGHERCGAVTAVVNGETKMIQNLANRIEPAVKASKAMTGDPIENAIKENILNTVAQLKKTTTFAELIQKGELSVVGGYYDLNQGSVEILK